MTTLFVFFVGSLFTSQVLGPSPLQRKETQFCDWALPFHSPMTSPKIPPQTIASSERLRQFPPFTSNISSANSLRNCISLLLLQQEREFENVVQQERKVHDCRRELSGRRCRFLSSHRERHGERTQKFSGVLPCFSLEGRSFPILSNSFQMEKTSINLG